MPFMETPNSIEFIRFPMEEFDVRYITKALWSTKILESAEFIDTELG
jgi:hypothetical protein